jgi:hydroxyethylthiazole kinase
MTITVESVWKDVAKIRETAPLVHNITNYVVMNTTANALLALGASPVMAHAEEEVEDMVGIAGALVVNIGTLSGPWVRSMRRAMEKARERGVPIVFDPVGAGATPFRTRVVRELLAAAPPAVIRGNASEINACVSQDAVTKGVDSTVSSDSAVLSASALGAACGSVVCVSGEVDYIVLGDRVGKIRNGHPMMPKVTGLGCTATALIGAFAAVNPSFFFAAAHAMAVMGIAGELAAEASEGPGSFQTHFLDALYNLTEAAVARLLRAESTEGRS